MVVDVVVVAEQQQLLLPPFECALKVPGLTSHAHSVVSDDFGSAWALFLSSEVYLTLPGGGWRSLRIFDGVF